MAVGLKALVLEMLTTAISSSVSVLLLTPVTPTDIRHV